MEEVSHEIASIVDLFQLVNAKCSLMMIRQTLLHATEILEDLISLRKKTNVCMYQHMNLSSVYQETFEETNQSKTRKWPCGRRPH